MDTVLAHEPVLPVRTILGWALFVCVLLAVASVIYFDDIQIVGRQDQEVPTIYTIRVFGGVKLIDAISISLFLLLAAYQLAKSEIDTSPFHKYIAYIFLTYCYAGLVGFIYGFFFGYDYLVWLQDFQPTIYMAGFFFLTFYALDTLQKWKIFVVSFLTLLALKNVLISYLTVMGIGKAIGDWAFRASQNAEFAYFPMMFFPLLLLFLKQRNWALRLACAAVMMLYLFNSFIGIYRTVWVMLLLGTGYLFFKLDRTSRVRLSALFVGGSLLTVAAISQLFPRFLELAWGFKFASIFSWSVESGDRSNAIRLIEVVNVVDRVFSRFAFLQGLGLGAWWDDSARRLLPDLGSGFTYKSRFHTTHMWYLTQLLKLGVAAMAVYWYSIYRMFTMVSKHERLMSWSSWEKCVILGLNVGLLCAFISSADFVRLFLVIGINLGITSSYLWLRQEPVPQSLVR